MSRAVLPRDFPQLATERLVLRELTLDDRESVFDNFSDREVTRYLMEPFTILEQADNIIRAFREEYEQGTGITWAVALKQDGAFLGTCGFEIKTGLRGEIGFDLSKAYWGMGYITEALNAIVAVGFETLGFDKVEAHTMLLNSRAIHLFKRLDFTVVGVLQESSWGNGKFWDEVFFSYPREDWNSR